MTEFDSCHSHAGPACLYSRVRKGERAGCLILSTLLVGSARNQFQDHEIMYLVPDIAGQTRSRWVLVLDRN